MINLKLNFLGTLQHQGNLEPKNEQFFGTDRANMALELMANGTENAFNEQSVEKSSNDPITSSYQQRTQKIKNKCYGKFLQNIDRGVF